MFARRVEPFTDADRRRDRTSDTTPDPRSRPGETRRAAVRVVERIVGELFKRPPR
jgi:hypothetical protein